MGQPVVYFVCDSLELVEKMKSSAHQNGVELKHYSQAAWKQGMDDVYFRVQLGGSTPSLTHGQSPLSPNMSMLGGSPDKVARMEEVESKAIETAILQYKGNLTEAAKALGIGRATLYRKVKQYNIDPAVARKKKSAVAA